ncbi:hypothetical protein HK100_004754 [Physocladia obscura]|uniref:non-specific serine/threonine protein kinase n=1 Tax=Physocladia obscura TaxID=109957 RepID=A0AAD5TAF5_9FUNG|nr:hypothetical protein HK100_004754 [Physocladia obscura]
MNVCPTPDSSPHQHESSNKISDLSCFVIQNAAAIALPKLMFNFKSFELTSHLVGLPGKYEQSAFLNSVQSRQKLGLFQSKLPPEIMQRIFEYIPLRHLLFCVAQLCKYVRSCIMDRSFVASTLKYRQKELMAPSSLKKLPQQIAWMHLPTPYQLEFAKFLQCKKPRRINWRYLDLTGVIPSGIGLIYSLKSLFLQGNRLFGSIPDEIGELVFLQFLDLSENNLSGSIPASLGKLNCLMELLLKENKFTGSIPREICALNNLNILDLSHNKFSGAIPPGLFENEHLRSIYLNNNELSGSIIIFPSLLNKPNLETILLNSNKLTGNVPSQLSKFTNLLGVKLSNNFLVGNIPEILAEMKQLRTIDLSDNQLQGIIPEFRETVDLRIDGNRDVDKSFTVVERIMEKECIACEFDCRAQCTCVGQGEPKKRRVETRNGDI